MAHPRKKYGDNAVFNEMLQKAKEDPAALDDEDIGFMTDVIIGHEGTTAKTDEEELEIRELFFKALALLGKRWLVDELLWVTSVTEGDFAARAIELLRLRDDVTLDALYEALITRMDTREEEQSARALADMLLQLEGSKGYRPYLAAGAHHLAVREAAARALAWNDQSFYLVILGGLTHDATVLHIVADAIRSVENMGTRDLTDEQIQQWCRDEFKHEF